MTMTEDFFFPVFSTSLILFNKTVLEQKCNYLKLELSSLLESLTALQTFYSSLTSWSSWLDCWFPFFMFILQFYCYSLFCTVVWGLNSLTLASFLSCKTSYYVTRSGGLAASCGWQKGTFEWTLTTTENVFSCCFCSCHHWLATQHKTEKDVVINSQSMVDAAHFSPLMLRYE